MSARAHAPRDAVVYHDCIVGGNIEVEAKWEADEREHERLRIVLRQAGASHTDTVHETNALFDSADGALRESRNVLRLRRLDDGHSILAHKGQATYREGVKTREETELHVADHDAMIAILNSLGFTVSLEYEKTRESWQLEGVVVALDILAFGHFVEIEGPDDEIRRTADLLGLDMAKTKRRGYPSMMRAHQARQRAD